MRIQPVDPAELTADQQQVHDKIAAGPRGRVGGPFPLLLHSPDLADLVSELGLRLRSRSALPSALVEMTIVQVAHHTNCTHMTTSHGLHAVKAGLPAEVVEGLGTEAGPAFADAGQAASYRFVAELLRDAAVTDEAYAAVAEHFGPEGVMDLPALVGYYQMVAYVLNAHGEAGGH